MDREKALSFLFILFVAALLGSRPPLGWDSYYFYTRAWNAPPLSTVLLPVVKQIRPLWILLSGATLMPAGSILVALPYWAPYAARMEDDQIAFPLVALAWYFWQRRKRELAYVLGVLATLAWKGGLLLLVMFTAGIAAEALRRRWVAAAGGALAGLLAGRMILSVGENNPLLAAVFLPLIALSWNTSPAYLASVAMTVVFPKAFFTAMPLMYMHAARRFARLPRRIKYTLYAAGVAAVVLTYFLGPPPLWMSATVCQRQTPDLWYIGWWCRAHGYDVPFAGSPPSTS